jgi:hypothetical protein
MVIMFLIYRSVRTDVESSQLKYVGSIQLQIQTRHISDHQTTTTTTTTIVLGPRSSSGTSSTPKLSAQTRTTQQVDLEPSVDRMHSRAACGDAGILVVCHGFYHDTPAALDNRQADMVHPKNVERAVLRRRCLQ